MSKVQSISLRSRWLGERLRQARTAAGYKLTDAGEYLQMDHTTLGRFERGTHRIRRSYVKDLIDFYGVSDQYTRDALLKLSDDAWRKDWWEGATTGIDTAFLDHAWLESRVTRIYQFEAMLMPGLLQCKDYAEALFRNGPEAMDSTGVGRVLDLRMARQQILSGQEPTPLAVILDESVLHRRIGGTHVHRMQLNHLVKMAAYPNVSIRLVPTDTGWHSGVSGPFTIFEMPDPYPDVAYVENLAGRTFLEEEQKVWEFRQAYDDIKRTALSEKESLRLIKRSAKE